MKNLLIVLFIFMSCNCTKPSESARIEGVVDGISVHVIDSCEYIVYRESGYSGVIIHKENCKNHDTRTN